MAIEEIHNPDDMTLVLRIQNDGSVEQTLADLNAALDRIEASLQDDDIYFRAIDLSGTWDPEEGEFNPADEVNVAAWIKLVENKNSLPGLDAWLARLETLLSQPDRYESIFESEQVQLAQVPLLALATRNRAYLPVFNRFLDLWDHEHDVMIPDCISVFFLVHKACPEVEDILTKMVTKYGGDGDLVEYDLRQLLEKTYGDFPQSDLFRKMVTMMHANCGDWKPEQGKRYIFSYTPSWPELGAQAEAILSELDAQAA